MEPSGKRLLQQMILLERKVGLLYSKFSDQFPGECRFWKTLASEEANHAAMLETLLEYIIESPELSALLLATKEETVSAINDQLEKIITNVGNITSREDALLIALQIEQSAGETHYQETAEMENSSVDFSVFQQLNSADRDHAKRISERIANLAY